MFKANLNNLLQVFSVDVVLLMWSLLSDTQLSQSIPGFGIFVSIDFDFCRQPKIVDKVRSKI